MVSNQKEPRTARRELSAIRHLIYARYRPRCAQDTVSFIFTTLLDKTNRQSVFSGPTFHCSTLEKTGAAGGKGIIV